MIKTSWKAIVYQLSKALASIANNLPMIQYQHAQRRYDKLREKFLRKEGDNQLSDFEFSDILFDIKQAKIERDLLRTKAFPSEKRDGN